MFPCCLGKNIILVFASYKVCLLLPVSFSWGIVCSLLPSFPPSIQTVTFYHLLLNIATSILSPSCCLLPSLSSSDSLKEQPRPFDWCNTECVRVCVYEMLCLLHQFPLQSMALFIRWNSNRKVCVWGHYSNSSFSFNTLHTHIHTESQSVFVFFYITPMLGSRDLSIDISGSSIKFMLLYTYF